MTNVYVITKEGRDYTDEGKKYIRDKLTGEYGVTGEIVMSFGQTYNDPETLADALKRHKDTAYVIISGTTGMFIYSPESNEGMMLYLKDHPDQTSWETLHACAMMELKEREKAQQERKAESRG